MERFLASRVTDPKFNVRAHALNAEFSTRPSWHDVMSLSTERANASLKREREEAKQGPCAFAILNTQSSCHGSLVPFPQKKQVLGRVSQSSWNGGLRGQFLRKERNVIKGQEEVQKEEKEQEGLGREFDRHGHRATQEERLNSELLARLLLLCIISFRTYQL